MLPYSHVRLIRKGLFMLNPSLKDNHFLLKDLSDYVYEQLDSPKHCAILCTSSKPFVRFLQKQGVKPKRFLGKRKMIVSPEKVWFTNNYYTRPKEITL